MLPGTSPPRGGPRASILALAAALCLATVACESRFPVCKTNEDCKSKASADPSGKSAKNLVCFDLRCVECRYDADCGDGMTCSRNKSQCEPLGGPSPKYGEPVPDPTTEIGPPPSPSASASAAPATKP